MAVAVPLIMGAMGASATAIAITTVAFAVTGISAKINKAAASVFGEDLVQIGNIFGAAYGAFSGAFSGAASAAESGASLAGETLSKAALDGTSAFGANSVAGAYNLADMAAGAESLSDAANIANSVDYGSEFANQANAITEMGGDAIDFTSAVKDQPSNVFDAIDKQPSPMDVANATQQPQSILPTSGSASTQAAAPDAAGAQTNAAGPGAARSVTAPPSVTTPPPAPPRSFFDKLLYDDKGNINPSTLRVGGQILSGYGTAAEKRRQLEQQIAEERRRASQGVGFRVTN